MNEIIGKNIVLRLVQPEDAAFVVSLRLDSSRNAYMSPVSNDLQAQEAWISRYKEREAAGLEYYFIIEVARNAVGTVRLYDFQGDSFCWGSWMIAPGVPPSVAVESALLVYEFAFYTLGFKGSHFDVRVLNERVVAFHLRFGAKIDHSTDLEHFFRYSKEDYEQTRQKYTRFLPAASSRS